MGTSTRPQVLSVNQPLKLPPSRPSTHPLSQLVSSRYYHSKQASHFAPACVNAFVPMSEEAKQCTLEQKLELFDALRRKALFLKKGSTAQTVEASTLARLMNSYAAQDVGFRQGQPNNKLPRVHISGVSFNSTPSAKFGEKPIETFTITFRDEQSGSSLPGSPLLIPFDQLMPKSS
jgi:hypothetical protein